MWDNLGRTTAEFIKTRQMLDKGYIQFEGLQHLDGHEGGFVIGAHLGNWEALSMLGPATGSRTGLIYRPLNNPYVSVLLKLACAFWLKQISMKKGGRPPLA